jgi:hypothetical protein
VEVYECERPSGLSFPIASSDLAASANLCVAALICALSAGQSWDSGEGSRSEPWIWLIVRTTSRHASAVPSASTTRNTMAEAS